MIPPKGHSAILPATGLILSSRLGLRGLLAGRAARALVDQAVVSGTGFAVAVLLARCSEPRELGLYGLGFSVIAGLYAVQSALITTPYALLRQRCTGSGDVAAGTAVGLQLALMAASAAGLLAASLAATEGLAAVLRMAAVAGPIMLGREFVRRMAYGQLRVDWALGIDVPTAGGQLALLVWLGWTDRLAAVTALAALGGGAVVGLVIGSVLLRSQVVRPGRRWRVHAAWYWRCGRWIAAAQALAAANAHGLLWLVAVTLDAEATGVFAACLWVVMLTNPLVYGLGNLLTPRAAEAWTATGPAGLHRLVVRASTVLAVATGVFALILTIWGGPALAALYGPEYASYGMTAAVLAWACAAGAAGMAINDGLRAMGRPDAELTSTAVDTVLTFGLGMIGLLLAGLLGLAWANLAGAVAGVGVQAMLYRRLLRGEGRS